MKNLTGARLFAGPKITYTAKARLERAKLAVVAARERAGEMAQQPPAKPMRITVLQKRRSAERQAAIRA
jgi:hypothetical protein